MHILPYYAPIYRQPPAPSHTAVTHHPKIKRCETAKNKMHSKYETTINNTVQLQS